MEAVVARVPSAGELRDEVERKKRIHEDRVRSTKLSMVFRSVNGEPPFRPENIVPMKDVIYIDGLNVMTAAVVDDKIVVSTRGKDSLRNFVTRFYLSDKYSIIKDKVDLFVNLCAEIMDTDEDVPYWRAIAMAMYIGESGFT